jgi:hypothetical protein
MPMAKNFDKGSMAVEFRVGAERAFEGLDAIVSWENA